MNRNTPFKSCSTQSKKQIRLNHSKTQELLYASFIHGQHDAFREHMENNPVQQNFYGRLKQGLKLVISCRRTMSDVAPTLIMLLQNGAKVDRKYHTMPGRMTPYHVICSSPGDHQELLKLMIKELGRSLLNARDDDGCTALMYAVSNANIKCVKSLIANRAKVNLMNDQHTADDNGALIDSISLLHPDYSHSYNTMMGIFDLLLNCGQM